MKHHFSLALKNITHHGDTDIFPFPFENLVFADKPTETLSLLEEYHQNFYSYLTLHPPRHVNSLTPAGYTGFRWATQLDPIWNAYFLGCVLSIADCMEEARIPLYENTIFSYRFSPNPENGDLFHRQYSWNSFMSHSLTMSHSHDYVVICDISEFYPRLSHHRLENALRHIAGDSDVPHRIMKFLENFSNTRSFGLPIGGPAARILSEITLNQVDHLLRNQGITFTRYADDYHFFATSRNQAYQHLISFSEKLFINQGLSLQKSKTRILSSSEFRATNPLLEAEDSDSEEVDSDRISGMLPPRSLFHLSLSFDPYSPSAEDDYRRLRNELRRFDIIGLLRSELQKTRIHAALSRRIVQAVRYLDARTRDDAIRTILENAEILYPIFSSVLLLLDQIFDDLSEDAQDYTVEKLCNLIEDDTPIMRVDIHLAFAIRVLSRKGSEATQAVLEQLYERRSSPLVRRAIILAIARWGEWYWLSELRNRFRELTGPERSAFLVASYTLSDEGRHWRDHIKKELTPMERLVRKWASGNAQDKDWKIPL